MKYTLEVVNCVGACAMAPVIIAGKKYYRNSGSGTVHEILGMVPVGVGAAESDEGGEE